MAHGALRLSAIALGAAVVALLTPVAPARSRRSTRMDHMDSRDPLVMRMDFTPADPRFIMDLPEAGVHRPAMRVVHGGGHRYALSGGRAYTHARHYGYAYGHRYAYGRHGYAYRHYAEAIMPEGTHIRTTREAIIIATIDITPPAYSYGHHHGCWWYRHYAPYDMPSWCYGPAYGYSAPVYGYSNGPSYGYVYGVSAGSWRGGHRGYAWMAAGTADTAMRRR